MYSYPGAKAKKKKDKKDKKSKYNQQYQERPIQQHQPYNQPSAYNPSSAQQAYQPPPGTPPDLSNLSNWFSYFDRDGSGGLDREEVVNGLAHTLQLSDPHSVRDIVYSVWNEFDKDGSGSISRSEFAAQGGLGETLVAMTGGAGGGRAAPQAAGGYPGNPPQPQYGQPPPQQPQYGGGQGYNPHAGPATPPPQMGVPIPEGITPGRQMKVQVAAGGAPQDVTVPDYAQWQYDEHRKPYFLIDAAPPTPVIPVAVPVAFTGTIGGGANAPPYNPNAKGYGDPAAALLGQPHQQFGQQNQQYGQQSHQPPPQAIQQPWTPWEGYQPRRYQPPPLAMQNVSQHELNQRQPIQPSGRFRALLIGINYKGTRAALKGCANDATNMKRMLVQSGFPDDSTHMVVLSDDRSAVGHGDYSPTGRNIRKGMQWLVHNASQGDILFFHFSGHGAQVEDKSGDEADGYDETILPVDFKTAGQICDDEIWGTLVYPLSAGVRLTSVMDCCHSGTGMDLPLDYNLKKGTWIEDVNPAYSRGDVMLFSGCEDDQTSADVQGRGKQAGGAMTQSFLAALQENPYPTYGNLIAKIRKQLGRRGFTQRPQLTSSQRFDVDHRVFMLTDGIEPNQVRQIGRLKRKKFKKKKKKGQKLSGGDILGVAAGAVVGGFLLDALF